MKYLSVVIVLGIAVAVFLTTRRGREVASRLGLHIPGKGAAPKEDHDSLLRVCGGDIDELKRRLDQTRKNNPELNEAGAYRRAIREHLKNKM